MFKLDKLIIYGKSTQDGNPTPTNPVTINSITGNQKIRLGKNLFNSSNTGTSFRTTITIIETGIRAVCTTTNRFCYGNFVIGGEELQGKTLTVSCNMVASGTNKSRALLYGLNANKGLVAGSTFGNFLDSNGSVTTTIPSTFPANVKYVALLLYSNTDSTTAKIGDYCDYTNVQVEIGSTQTTYEEPNEITIPLGTTDFCSMEESRDQLILNCVTGEIRKISFLKKIIFNGTETWRREGTGTSGVYRFSYDIADAVQSDTALVNSINSSFPLLVAGGTYSQSLGYTIGNNKRLYCRYDEITTIEAFQTLLSNNNMTLIYKTPESTETTIGYISSGDLEKLKTITLPNIDNVTYTESDMNKLLSIVK